MVPPMTKNRRYLICPAILICLIIITIGPTRAGVDFTSFGYRTTMVYSDGSQNRWIMGKSITAIRYSTTAFGLHVGLGISHFRPDGDLRWGYEKASSEFSNSDNLEGGQFSGRIFFEEPQIRTVLSLGNADNRLSGSLDWQHKGGGRDGLSGEIWWPPFKFLRVGIKYGKSYPLPEYSELFYRYKNSSGEIAREGGRINWQAPARLTESRLIFTPLKYLVIESVIREIEFNPELPRPDESTTDSYAGTLEGALNDRRIEARCVIEPGWNIAIEYRHIEADARLKMYDNGQRFAHFGVVKGDATLRFFRMKYYRWFFNLCSGSIEGELKGVIDAWPFVDGLLIFLGERRHFVSEMKADWELYSVGGRLFQYRKLNFELSSDYLHIEPDLRYVTWRPKWFGMGYDDLKSGRLDIFKADLIRLSLKPMLKFDGWQLLLDLSQWIPIAVGKYSDKNSSGTPSGQPSDNGSTTDKNSNNTWGGFSAQLSLVIDF